MPEAETLVFNGIDADTGQYSIPPMTVDELAARVKVRPNIAEPPEELEAFRVFDLDIMKLQEAGWAAIYPDNVDPAVRDAVSQLVQHRAHQAGGMFKELTYRKGEQVRDWYKRNKINFGSFEPQKVPHYLLIVGRPTEVPFEFQYLLGIEYSVGRIAFDKFQDYARYAQYVVQYETAQAISNRKEIVFWGTRHPGDRATELSATSLVGPLANGVPEATSKFAKPVHERVKFSRTALLNESATRDALIGAMRAEMPPAVLFTASHGMEVRLGKPNQVSDNGALLCQDWSGLGTIKRTDYLAGVDVGDDANIGGTVVMLFACYGGGTPAVDEFIRDLDDPEHSAPLAPQPFVASLPQRLLAHPRGSALAVIAHVDRAWGFSIKSPGLADATIKPFSEALCFILAGDRVGRVLFEQFGTRYTALAATLLSALAPTTPSERRLSDRDLVTSWIECNDARNYVLLGDPAVHIRTGDLVSP